MDKIAIIGIGCRLPGGIRGPEEFWEALTAGKDMTSDLPEGRWDLEKFYDPDKSKPGKHYTCHGGFLDKIDEFDPLFFGISPREAAFLDPQQRLMLETSWEAMEDGGLDPAKLAGTNTGVFVAGFTLDYQAIQFKNESVESLDTHSATGMMMTMLSNRISYIYDFRGPSLSVDTACSGSLVATHLACGSLLNNECNLAIAGGVSVIATPEYTIAESKGGFLSPDGRCKTFDSSANGYARGEGAGVVVLKRLSDAIEDGDRIYAVISGSGVNQDGHTDGITVPNGQAQENLMKEVYKKAGISPSDITYIEAHGTGTPVGDPIEANAIARVVSTDRPKDKKCIVGSVKTNIAHLEAAAGVAALIKASLIIKHKQIPPHLHFKNPNPKIPFDDLCIRIPQTLEPLPQPALVGINSFGFGGTNAHILLEEATDLQKEGTPEVNVNTGWPYMIPISARSEKALKNYAQKYVDFINGSGESISLYDIGSMMSKKRTHHDYRLAVSASSKEELAGNLEAYIKGQARQGMSAGNVEAGKYNKAVFVYTGMGPIWWAMGRQLLEKDPVFRNMIEKCDKLTRQYAGWSLLEELLADEENSRLDQPQFAQPANFAVQVGLTEVWKSLGIIPHAVVGHSVGEVASTYVAGIYSLEDAMLVSIHRSRAQQKAVNKGTMLAVGLPEKEVVALLDENIKGVSMAAINSPNSVTLSGDPDALEQIQKQLQDKGVFARLLKVNVAYHSYQMEPYEQELLEALKGIKSQPAGIPIYSTVTGKMLTGTECDGHYWYKNVREPVRFEAAMYEMISLNYNLFIEVGPHPVLAASISDCLSAKNVEGKKLFSIKRNENEQVSILENLGNLYALGYPIDWNKIYRYQGEFVSLPLYPWQWDKYWMETQESSEFRQGKNKHKFLGRRLKTSSPIWEIELNTTYMTYLSDHKIQGIEVFPGAGYVELGMACARSYFGEGFYTVEDIKFENALFLNQGVSPVVQVVLDPKTAKFEISSRIPGQDKTWTCNASGTIRKRQNIKITAKDELIQILGNCTKEYGKEVCYKTFYQMGFHYGPYFQGIDKIWKGDNEALGRIEIPKILEIDSSIYGLHPAVLDACFQVTIAAVAPLNEDENNEGQSFLPVGIDRVQLYGRPEPVMLCHTQMVDRKDNNLNANIRLYSEDGNLIAEILGIRTKELGNSEGSDAGRVKDYLYEINWELLKSEEVDTRTAAANSGAWLIFVDHKAAGKELANLLEKRGEECFMVYPGENFGWQYEEREIYINPRSIEDLRALFDEFSKIKTKLTGIVYMWSLNILEIQEVSNTAIEKACFENLFVLKHLVQATTNLGLNFKLWVITRGAQMINRATPNSAFLQSLVWGLGTVIGYHELPSNWGGLVDLDIEANAGEMEMLLKEVLGNGENQIAFRNGNRLAARIDKLRIDMQHQVPVHLRPDGSYVITGAFGGIGMITAQWMVAKGARHLVLLGRGEFPKRSEWNNVEPGSSLAERIEFVRKLESQGATVYIGSVDVTDEEKLAGFFKDFDKEERPPIRGVVHSAGITDDQFLEVSKDETFYRVLSPKVNGAWNLHRMTEGRPIDFFILFSSVASVFGSPGQGAYATGNAFLDSLAHYRLSRGLPALSINWGPWSEVGMAARFMERDPEYYIQKSIESVTVEKGIRAMEHLVGEAVAQSVVLPILSWQTFGEKWFSPMSSPHVLKTLLQDESGQQENINKSKVDVDILEDIVSSPIQSRQNIVEMHIKTIVAKVLRYNPEDLSTKQPLTVFGMDSLMATEIKNRMEVAFKTPVSIVELLKGSSIYDLSEQMISKLYESGKISEQDSLNMGKAELERIPKVSEKEYYETSSAQKMMYIINNFEGNNIGYNIPVGILFEGGIERVALGEALKTLIQRHEAFRTSFEMIDGELVQRIQDEVDFTIEYFESEEDGVEKIIDEFVRPFDLSKAPLIRVGLIEIHASRQILLLDVHHIVSDGTSIIRTFDEIVSILSGESLPAMEVQYKDFAQWQNGLFSTEVYKKQEEYWLNRFKGEIPILDMPTDYPRPVLQSFEGNRLLFDLDSHLMDKLNVLSSQTGATVYMILLAALNTLMYKYSGQEDIIIGTPIAARTHFDTERILGMFINTLALRNFPEGNKAFTEFLEEVKESSLEAYENQEYRFDQFVTKLNVKRDSSRNPLFTVMFNIVPSDEHIMEHRGELKYSKYPVESKTSKFDLTFQLIPDGHNIILWMEYATRLFKKETVERLVQHYFNILEEITSNPEKKLSEINMLSQEEKERIIYGFNDTKVEFEHHLTVHHLFEQQTKVRPDNIAVAYEGRRFTYGQINQRANRIARYMLKAGTGREEAVVVMLERGPLFVESVLGIWKAGGAYIPVNPKYPTQRVLDIFKESKAAYVLTLSDYVTQQLSENYKGRIIYLDQCEKEIEAESGENLDLDIDINSLAYVIYTSGSTGVPKGAMIEHLGMINHIHAEIKELCITNNSIISQNSPQYFDVSVWQFFAALTIGAQIIIYPDEIVKDVARFTNRIIEDGITVLEVVPSYLALMLEYVENTGNKPEKLHYLLITGETVKSGIVRKWFDLCPNTKVVNAYGPAEAADDITLYTMEAAHEGENIPVGKPIQNMNLYITDKNMNLCPIGVKGEICVSGTGVGRGYLNDPEKTAHVFLEDPFREEKGIRLYKTGDLGRWLPDGNIEFLGRIDHQVKIRGYRIELGEIEAQLLKHSSIKEVVAATREDPQGNKYICAYIVGESELTIPELREYLSKDLPDYMIPSYFVQLEKLPLSANGKVDRNALPAPDGNINTGVDYAAPFGEIEEKLVLIWSQILGVQKIGVNDNFFELGGDSLKATNLVSRVHKEFDIEFALKEVFMGPTISAIAKSIKNRLNDTVEIEEILSMIENL
ncbi:non-ribosomal peptide synthetase/type I polyketide synthase [Paenibacillus polymyxa]|uniref:non-ribosomal peptide synthetase/type I polyketide synthase n=1 Tax=Paenibacillus polymyxa TaxID=1406 RepID=UPI00202584E9|nr:non-ribosomal peptide synthetase/type I polyketide synthase [Paenibacillus polymyxa]WDZ54630.1 amino acid adenylation domain-containing protein [Paenibacillus polymyxa]